MIPFSGRQNIPGEPEKSYHFKRFIAPTVLHRFEGFKSQVRAERLKYFRDLLAVLTALEVSVNLIL